MDTLNVNGQAAQPIELPIAQGPATGYSWVLDLPPDVARIADGDPSPPSADRVLGAASGASIRVTAPAGRYTIVARLVRSWDTAHPAKTLSIELTVK